MSDLTLRASVAEEMGWRWYQHPKVSLVIGLVKPPCPDCGEIPRPTQRGLNSVGGEVELRGKYPDRRTPYERKSCRKDPANTIQALRYDCPRLFLASAAHRHAGSGRLSRESLSLEWSGDVLASVLGGLQARCAGIEGRLPLRARLVELRPVPFRIQLGYSVGGLHRLPACDESSASCPFHRTSRSWRIHHHGGCVVPRRSLSLFTGTLALSSYDPETTKAAKQREAAAAGEGSRASSQDRAGQMASRAVQERDVWGCVRPAQASRRTIVSRATRLVIPESGAAL